MLNRKTEWLWIFSFKLFGFYFYSHMLVPKMFVGIHDCMSAIENKNLKK